MKVLSIALSIYGVSGYGILRVIALLAGLALAVYLAYRHGVNRYEALKLGILVLFVALLGRRPTSWRKTTLEQGRFQQAASCTAVGVSTTA